MKITDYNRCKGCMDYGPAEKATGICYKECKRRPYPMSNILAFTARDRFGSVEYKLDLRGITTMMSTSEQNQVLAEIRKCENAEDLLIKWLHYTEWLYEHERDVTPAPIRRRMSNLRTKQIEYLKRIQNAG